MDSSHLTMISPSGSKSILSDGGSLLSEEEVKEALSSSNIVNCCYGRKLCRDMIILEIRDAPIFRYSVEIFSEQRKKQWTTVPYKGEPINTTFPTNDPSIYTNNLWALDVKPSITFGKGKKSIEVPGTVTIVNCAQCNGIGSIQCGQCGGSQTNPCSSCVGYGFGQVLMEDGTAGRVVCPSCHGKGRIPCNPCSKRGVILCSTCKGTRKVKNYEKLDVSWKTSYETSTGRSTGKIQLPPKLLTSIRGTLLVENISSVPTKHKAFDSFQDFLETELSKIVVQNHSQRILEIRQRIYSIPAAEISYHWKGQDGYFLIYGHENLVYFPEGQNPTKYKCNIL